MAPAPTPPPSRPSGSPAVPVSRGRRVPAVMTPLCPPPDTGAAGPAGAARVIAESLADAEAMCLLMPPLSTIH